MSCLRTKHNVVTPVRLELAIPWSQGKYSTTGQSLRSHTVYHVGSIMCIIWAFMMAAFLSTSSTHWRPETSKRILWQTVKTQMKCRIRRHFIRVCTVCYDKIDLQRKNCNLFSDIITYGPSVCIMDHSYFIVCSSYADPEWGQGVRTRSQWKITKI